MSAQTEELKDSVLLGRNLDWLLVGGLSLVFFAFFHLFVSQGADTGKLALVMYYLSLVINWPHFMLSYQLLYWDKRRELLRKPSYLWAGIAAPLILILILTAGFFRRDDVIFSLMVHVMFLTVGWHYVKQVFGTIVVTSSLKSYYLSRFERGALLASLYSLWALSFVGGQLQNREAEFFGIRYDLLGFSTTTLTAVYGVVLVTSLAAVGALLWRYVREGRTLARAGWVSYLSLLAWYLPFASHPHFFYMIPFFHSLQYLLFVSALKKNQWTAEVPEALTPKRRRWLARHGILYFGIALLSGLMVFWWIPNALDQRMESWDPDAALFWSPTIFMGVIQLFINIHHYFIDNVLWRSDNVSLRKYLFRRGS